MLELRKDIFADERDDNLNEIGKGTQRQDMLGHVTGTLAAIFDDHSFEGLLHLKVLRSPHHHARIRRIDVSGGRARARREARHPRRRRAGQPEHAAQPDQFRQGRRAVARRRQGALQGRADRRRSSPTASASVRGAGKGAGRLRSAAAGVRRRGGAQARRAGRQRDLSEELPSSITTSTITRSCASATSSEAFAQADHVLEQRYQMSPIEHAPTETNGSIAAPETNDRFVVLLLRAGAVLLARHHGEDPRRANPTSCTSSAARSAAASAARSIRSPSRSPFSARC